jgi:CRISPR-associated endonuclease/helicase Cas3
MAKKSESLVVGDFAAYFAAVHDKKPFPWQSMLMERVAEEGWPDLIDLPTASGKTACMDVAVFALAMGLQTPRRIWFVVDRRIVVDEAYQRAERIACALQEAKDGILAKVRAGLLRVAGCENEDRGMPPLGIARLRGGTPRTVAWAKNPVQPAIITSTIDQLGSRLLFRGYGVGDRAKPIHAALTGNDSLIILDEAHLAQPFMQTVKAVERFRKEPWAKESLDMPFKLVVMSATPPGKDDSKQVVFPRNRKEKVEALKDDILQRRIKASKPAELVVAAKPKNYMGTDDDFVADAANRAKNYVVAQQRQRVAVMVNRVATAQEIVKQLYVVFQTENVKPDIQLLTGRLRPVDRDEFIKEYEPKLESGSDEKLERPIILVTTQCLEVGADFSFDALVTECASLDSLRQRFGRLNRLGDKTKDPSPATILARKKDIKPDKELNDDKPLDPIYGNALARTWNWLQRHGSPVDMGIAAIQPAIDELRESGKYESLVAPTLDAPLMLPAYVDLWSQTQPRPNVEADVALFLHGVPPPEHKPRAEVRVLWRRTSDRETLQDTPPLSAEMLTMPLREFVRAIAERKLQAADDLEGGFEKENSNRGESPAEATEWWVWRNGKLESKPSVVLRPNDVVILAAEDAGMFQLLCPNTSAPADVYEWAYWKTKRTMAIRYPLALQGTSADELDSWQDEKPTWNEETLEIITGAIKRVPVEKQREWLTKILDSRSTKNRPLIKRLGKAGSQFLITQRPEGEPLVDWGFETDDDDDQLSVEGNGSVHGKDHNLLATHTEDVRTAAHWLTQSVLKQFASAISAAAQMHDWGKGDERFQAYLAGGRRAGTNLLAKSRDDRGREMDRKVRDFCRVPPGFRHEMLSLQLASIVSDIPEPRHLVLHLIASHHGFARPFAPVVDDAAPPDIHVDGAKGISLTSGERANVPPHRLDSGVAERFWQLTRQFGWWGLAYLEAILRCADCHASALGQRKGQI